MYPNLQMMEDEGLIKAEVKDEGKRAYAITDAGRAELEKQKDAADRVWSRASQWDDWSDMMSPGALEVMGPAMRLARAAFSKAARGDDKLVERIRQILANAAAGGREGMNASTERPAINTSAINAWRHRIDAHNAQTMRARAGRECPTSGPASPTTSAAIRAAPTTRS